VSDGSNERRPIERPMPETNPFHPSDRVRFRAPPRALLLLQHQNDVANSETGATLPVRCDPDPNSDGPGTAYQTTPAFDRGASPAKLRGVFAFTILSTGSIAVLDVDDWDANCRGPRDEQPILGCTNDPPLIGLDRSGEFSCNTVAPHQPRSSVYLVHTEGTAVGTIHNQPSIASFPLLFSAEGTLVKLDSDEGAVGPRMRSTQPTVSLVVGQDLHQLSANGLLLDSAGVEDPLQHTLAMNLDDPRAHIVDQNWTVTFEGGIPGFEGRFGALSDAASSTPENPSFELSDPSSLFCSRGVLSKTALLEELAVEGGNPPDADVFSDYLQIISDSPIETDAYWSEQNVCSFQECRQGYGSAIAPLRNRDLRVVEATQDRLQLEPRASLAGLPSPSCCFPGVIEYRVRGGNQWMVVGEQVGFMHNIIRAESGVCRKSCDPAKALLQSRVRGAPRDAVPVDGEPFAFHNPFFRFAVNQGENDERDMQFRYATTNAFRPLQLEIGGGQSDILPTAVRYLESTGELVVSDGGLEGVVFIDLNAFAITRQYN
jgi:hypothetical protein